MGHKSWRDAGYGMKISWRDWNAPIDGMRDSLKLLAGVRDLNSK